MSEDAPAPAWPCPQLATSILWASHRQRSTRPTHSHCSGGQTEAPRRGGFRGGSRFTCTVNVYRQAKPRPTPPDIMTPRYRSAGMSRRGHREAGRAGTPPHVHTGSPALHWPLPRVPQRGGRSVSREPPRARPAPATVPLAPSPQGSDRQGGGLLNPAALPCAPPSGTVAPGPGPGLRGLRHPSSPPPPGPFSSAEPMGRVPSPPSSQHPSLQQ